VSPAVRKVLACNNLEGDTEAGRVVDRLAPEVVIARLMRGTASSIRMRSLRMSWAICRISTVCAALDLALLLFLLDDSSALAAFSSRVPRDWMSQRRALVSVTADSKVVLPLAELEFVSPMIARKQ
jgi:hypothetical protein